MNTYTNSGANHSLGMRFVVENDCQENLWLVFDTMNGNFVGVHESQTLAMLDAFKREPETYLQEPVLQKIHLTAA